mmetsp:Transcript_40052/g.159342  ORF Transcript_40052/g.159342 Transcript_40052/m.159342 type:complete len:90 (-) Transcript_40052:181-450(-)
MCYYILLIVFLGVLWSLPKTTIVLTSKQRAKLKAHKERVQEVNLKSKEIYVAHISESMNLDGCRNSGQPSFTTSLECELEKLQCPQSQQ